MEIKLPKLGANMETAVLEKWLKSEGEMIQKDEPIAEVSTDKVTVQIDAPRVGLLKKKYFQEDDDVPVGATIAIIDLQEVDDMEISDQKLDTINNDAISLVGPEKNSINQVKAAPSIRRLATKLGIDLSKVNGSGPGGRILKEDILNISISENSEKDIEIQPNIKKKDMVDLIVGDDNSNTDEEVYKLKKIEKVSGERMLKSIQTTAQLTLTREMDVTETIELLNAIKNSRGTQVSFTTIIIKAVAQALKEHKRFNGRFNGEEIIISKNVNLNIAVATEYGLVVPIMRNVEQKTLLEVSEELQTMVKKARNAELSPESHENGNFTITNLGATGVDTFTPILNPGQIGILGVGRIIEKPWVYKGNIQVRKMLNLSLTWDHRAIDGYPAALFMKRIAENLETPGLMM